MSTAVFGAPEFRARSGRTVKSRSDGSVLFDHANGYLSPASVMDAEELFQAKRDAELGRWRCPTETDWVAREGVRTADGRTVVVVNERTLDRFWFNERVRDAGADVDVAHRVGRAYFEAHPERKPWEDAKPGEIWDLIAEGKENRYAAIACTIPSDNSEVIYLYPVDDMTSPKLGVTAPVITAGVRVFPEDAS